MEIMSNHQLTNTDTPSQLSFVPMGRPKVDPDLSPGTYESKTIESPVGTNDHLTPNILFIVLYFTINQVRQIFFLKCH